MNTISVEMLESWQYYPIVEIDNACEICGNEIEEGYDYCNKCSDNCDHL